MADNVGYTPGVGATVAADEIAGALHQRIKLTLGADGVNDGDVSSTNPLPVTGGLTDAQLRAAPVPVSGPLTNAELRASPAPVEVLGEAIEAIEAIRYAIQSLTRTIGLMQPDSAARMRVAIDAITGGLTLATITTVSTVTTVTTVSTVTNQSQMGGVSANDQIPALMTMRADGLRRNITVT